MPDEVAVFIDFENLRYGLLNNYGQEPDIASIVRKAERYGRPTIIRAYADFTEHPEGAKRQLAVAGVEAINVPVKRSTYVQSGRPVERVKNAADMYLAIDALSEAVEADGSGKVKTFRLVSGDRDYVKLVTQLRNRFGQKVVIAGVPGTVARDLVAAAGHEDPIEVDSPRAADKQSVKRAIVALVKRRPLAYWSLKIIDQWAQDARNAVPGTAKERRDAISELVSEGVLIRTERIDERRGTVAVATLDETLARSMGYGE